jgi:hypothetical protein
MPPFIAEPFLGIHRMFARNRSRFAAARGHGRSPVFEFFFWKT